MNNSQILKVPQHTITALVQNETGTINRLVSLFRRRGFSIACFNAGDCEQPDLSRLTLVVNGSEDDMRQCVRQLEKLVDVIEVEDLQPAHRISRELVMVKLNPTEDQGAVLETVLQPFKAKVALQSDQGLVVEATVDSESVEKLVDSLKPFNILEIVRTGAVAIKISDLE